MRNSIFSNSVACRVLLELRRHKSGNFFLKRYPDFGCDPVARGSVELKRLR